MRIRSSHLTAGVEEWQKPPAASPDKSCHRVSVPRAMTSPLNGIYPRSVGRARGRRANLIKQRMQAASSQLQCFPSDYRVDGARHASYDSATPVEAVTPP